MKKFITVILAISMLLGTVAVIIPFLSVTANAADVPDYVKSGLVSLYNGAGQAASSAVWKDLVGSNDVEVPNDKNNKLTSGGFKSNGNVAYFPQAIVDLVNGSEFTVEIFFGDFTSIGADFNTFMNSSNDNFALFRRVSNDKLEFKHSGTGGANRPTVENGLELLQNSLISVTFKQGGKVIIYVNGAKAAEANSVGAMNADDLFVGHTGSNKLFDTVYRTIRFYDRELTASEIASNYAIDDALYTNYEENTEETTAEEPYVPGQLCSDAQTYLGNYVGDGLAACFSGKYNTRAGHSETASTWEDLVGDNYLEVTLNQNNKFTADALHNKATQDYFSDGIVDIVNGQSFTVEILFGEFLSIGGTFNTFMNSSNDNFALFRRNASDVIEFKYYANAQGERTQIPDALASLQNALITVTYKVGGSCKVYVNGQLGDERDCLKTMGAGDLFIGHGHVDKQFEADYEAIRFYTRELSAEEVAANAKADGVYTEAPKQAKTVTVAQPVTNVVGDIAAVREINGADELNAVINSQTPPATVIFNINSKLEVLGGGAAFTTVPEALGKLDCKIMAAFRIQDAETAQALAEYLSGQDFFDCFIISNDAPLLCSARELMPQVRGIIDYTGNFVGKTLLTEEECLEIRKSLHTNMGTVALLPADVCSNDTVQYLYDGIVNVWVKGKDAPSTADLYAYILSGAIGVVTDATDALLDIACNKLEANTLTRAPLNIGHRGIPSKAPENTVEGYLAAVENGANVVECDIYLTKDNQIVIMHDGDSSRTCNGSLSIENSTLEQLKELYVNKGYENSKNYSECRIPTLEEMLVALKDKDCRLFIEIKSNKANLVPLMKELIEKYGMYGQCSVITFLPAQMENIRKYYPEMTCGYLTSGILDEAGSDADMRYVMKTIGGLNTTLNPSYGGYGEKAIRAALIRGISVYPWTFTEQSGYASYFVWGYSGLTGNNADIMGKYVKSLAVEVKDGVFTAAATRYNGKTADVSANIVIKIIDGQATVEGNKVTPTGASATVIAEYTCKAGSKPVTYCSEIFTLKDNGTAEETTVAETTAAGSSETSAPAETNAQTSAPSVTSADDAETDAPGENKSGCCSVIAGSAPFAIIPALAFLGKKKKNGR